MSDLSDYEISEFSESFDSEDEDFDIKAMKFLTMTRKRSPRTGLIKIVVIFTKSESSWYLKAN